MGIKRTKKGHYTAPQLTLKQLRRANAIWRDKWPQGTQTSPYSPEVLEAWREEDISVESIIEEVRYALAAYSFLPQKDPRIALLRTFREFDAASEHNIRNRVTQTPGGQIFILKAKYGYRETQNINVTGDLQSVIAQNSPHNPDAIDDEASGIE
jgi:hypothetical protein